MPITTSVSAKKILFEKTSKYWSVKKKALIYNPAIWTRTS